MENKDYLEQNIKNLISSHGEEQKMDEEQKQRIVEELITNDKSAANSGFNVWRKIAIAAVIILIPVLLAIFLHNAPEQITPKIEIPPELASMSIDELFKLNYDTSQDSFDPNIVKLALKQALENKTPEEVIQFAKMNKTGSPGRGGMAASVGYERIATDSVGRVRRPFPEIVEESSLLVHATLTNYEINVDDIIAALIEQESRRRIEDFLNSYRVTIQMNIIDCLPENTLKAGDTISVTTVLYEDQLNELKTDTEYYFAMKKGEGNKPVFLTAFSGVYPVDFSDPVNVELWQFFKDSQDILLYGQSPDTETIDYWLSKLEGDTLKLALEYMDVLPDDLVPADSLMLILEQRYKDFMLQKQANANATISEAEFQLFIKITKLILRSDDKASIRRVIALYEKDTHSGNNSIFWSRVTNRRDGVLPLMLKMNIASEENNISQRLMNTYEEYKNRPMINQGNPNNQRMNELNRNMFLSELYNEVIIEAQKMPYNDAKIFLENVLAEPSKYGFPSQYGSDDAQKFGRIWSFMASHGDLEIRAKLKKYIEEPELSDIGFDTSSYKDNGLYAFEQAAFEALQKLPDSLRPSHEEMVSYLCMIYERHKDNQSNRSFVINTMGDILQSSDTESIPVIIELLEQEKPHWALPVIIKDRIPDPVFVPVIRKIIANDNYKATSRDYMIEALYACGEEDEAINKALEVLSLPLNDESWDRIYRGANIKAGLLNFLGTTGRKELIEIIEPYTTNSYYDTYKPLFDSQSIGYCVSEIQQNAIMAMTRLGGKSVNATLREIYKTTSDIRVRIVSALALWYNGDKTGGDLLQYFVEGRPREVPEIDMRWFIDLNGGMAFQSVIKSYLRNEYTDALWLEKIKNSFERADADIDSDFYKENRIEILKSVVDLLYNNNREVRSIANEMLIKATGQNFGFDSERYSGQQADIIEQWREYIDSIE